MKSSTIFYKTLRWSVTEALMTQLIYLVHQWALFAVLDLETFGVVGIVFSALYMIINACNLGFDSSLTSTFALIKADRRLAVSQLKLHGALSCVVAFSLLCIGLISAQKGYALPPTTYGIALIALLSEAARKFFRSVLVRAGKIEITTRIETFFTSGYVLSVWAAAALGLSLTLTTLLIPLALYASISSLFLGIHLWRWIDTIPLLDAPHTLPLSNTITTRVLNGITGLTQLSITSNALTPLVAVTGGLSYAGFFALISSTTYSIHSIARRTLGFSADASLAHDTTHHETFSALTRCIFQSFSTCLPLVMVITCFPIPYYCTIAQRLVMILCMTLLAIEQCIIAYEKVFLFYHATLFITTVSVISLGTLIACITQISCYSPLTVLATVVLLRILTATVLAVTAFNRWKLIPEWRDSLNLLGTTRITDIANYIKTHSKNAIVYIFSIRHISRFYRPLQRTINTLDNENIDRKL